MIWWMIGSFVVGGIFGGLTGGCMAVRASDREHEGEMALRDRHFKSQKLHYENRLSALSDEQKDTEAGIR